MSAKKAARVEAIHVGTELLTFKYNAHTVYLAESLRPLGLSLKRAELVNDDLGELTNAIRGSLKRADLIFVTGGLGPTFDDLTREAAGEALGLALREDPRIVRELHARFRRLNAAMPKSNLRQAQVIEGAEILKNDVGTAPGQILKAPGGKLLILLPGPPEELRNTLAKAMPHIQNIFGREESLTSAFHIAGFAESKAEELAKPLLGTLDPQEINSTILASPHVIDFIFTASGKNRQKTMERIRQSLRKIFGENFFGEDAETLESAVGALLKAKKQTVAFAESCTGGLLANRVTNLPGSSVYFLESVVSYANKSKENRLGVREETLKKHGAVSAECAAEMASGAQKNSGADWAVSVTGICGPGGATSAKPIGLVYFGLARPEGIILTEKRIYQYPRERILLKDRMASFALDFLRLELLKD